MHAKPMMMRDWRRLRRDNFARPT